MPDTRVLCSAVGIERAVGYTDTAPIIVEGQAETQPQLEKDSTGCTRKIHLLGLQRLGEGERPRTPFGPYFSLSVVVLPHLSRLTY